MIYEKNGAAYPAGKNSNRYSNVFEYMFVFCKGKIATKNLIKDKKINGLEVQLLGKAQIEMWMAH
jgi:hypothetical protein